MTHTRTYVRQHSTTRGCLYSHTHEWLPVLTHTREAACTHTHTRGCLYSHTHTRGCLYSHTHTRGCLLLTHTREAHFGFLLICSVHHVCRHADQSLWCVTHHLYLGRSGARGAGPTFRSSALRRGREGREGGREEGGEDERWGKGRERWGGGGRLRGGEREDGRHGWRMRNGEGEGREEREGDGG